MHRKLDSDFAIAIQQLTAPAERSYSPFESNLSLVAISLGISHPIGEYSFRLKDIV
jgi:hypothetical protein